MTQSRPYVLFADDGSAGADVAWLWVIDHDWVPWDVRVLHVDQAPVGYHGSGDPTAPSPWQPPTPRRLPTENGWVTPEHDHAEGDPRVVLNRCHDARLLVLGARGHGVWKSMHVGSTAEWLLSSPPTSLAMIRSGRPVRRMVVCVDGSGDADVAARSAAGLPWIGRVSVTVLGVEERGIHPGTAVERVVGVFRDAGAETTAVVREAGSLPLIVKVRDVVLQTAQAVSADMLVLGSRGRSGMAGLRRGSVSTGLVRHARCSVLVARGDVPD